MNLNIFGIRHRGTKSISLNGQDIAEIIGKEDSSLFLNSDCQFAEITGEIVPPGNNVHQDNTGHFYLTTANSASLRAKSIS